VFLRLQTAKNNAEGTGTTKTMLLPAA